MTLCRRINIISFGYKHGPPPPADLLFNVRFIKNPYHLPGLSDKDGSDPAVARFILEQPCVKRFLPVLQELLRITVLEYIRSPGPNYQEINIALGCAGGRQRSVCLALICCDMIEALLTEHAMEASPRPQVVVRHRDISSTDKEGVHDRTTLCCPTRSPGGRQG